MMIIYILEAREYYQAGQVATCAQILNDAPTKHGLNSAETADLTNYKAILDIVSSQPSVHQMNTTAQQQVLSYVNSGGLAEGMARGIMGLYGYHYDPQYELPDDPEERDGQNSINLPTPLKVSPNPADKYLTINNIPADAVQITITGREGKIITELTMKDGQNTIDISTLNYHNGIYFFRITTRSGTTENGKFIVQH